MLDNPCMLGNPAPGVTARILYLLLFFIPIAIQKSLLLLSPVRSYNAEPTCTVPSKLWYFLWISPVTIRKHVRQK
ncbi:hypothetical protein M011DRAFT_9597 [Sporormia fimetaria CBS 119925]|uniref:Uncharacterized protein n=1 Tax=Sporormia fimetaria CBS 119925 TaxID=1340428 RepID=A0A6A6VQ56_9PLEO|nr:hypothetical protein M011DRAFT_9597 [Sporormia fimetaria CBS 119925]